MPQASFREQARGKGTKTGRKEGERQQRGGRWRKNRSPKGRPGSVASMEKEAAPTLHGGQNSDFLLLPRFWVSKQQPDCRLLSFTPP